MQRHLITAGVALALAASAALGACSQRENQYVGSDTPGAGAPATKRDMSETVGAPDSTAGLGDRSGRPGMAGDSASRRTGTKTPAPRPGTRP